MSKRIKTIVSIITSSLVVLNMGVTTGLSCMAKNYDISAEISSFDIEETPFAVIPVVTTAIENNDEAVVTTTSVTSPISSSNTTEVEYYGFSVEQSEVNLSIGESFKIGVNFELPVYYEDSLIFDSSNREIASISSDGIVVSNSEGTAVISISAKFDPKKVGLAEDTNIVRTLKISINVTADKSLSVNQQGKLSILKEKGDLLIGEFVREEKVLLGEFDSDAARITRDDVDVILSGVNSFQDVHDKLESIAKYPDFYGGSGVTKIEYWFDEYGNEKILLLCEQEDVIYVNCSDKGNIITWENLYSTNEKEASTLSELVLVGTYKIYNNIDDSEVVVTETTKPLSTTNTTTTTTVSTQIAKKLISQNDIIELSNKGEALTWSDFEEYKYTDIGSGLYIWELKIKDSNAKLLISGGHLLDAPNSILYVYEDGTRVDIRTEEFEPLLDSSTSTTVPTTTESTTTSYKSNTETTTLSTITATTESKNTEDEELPQTGMPYARAVEGIAALLTLGGAALIVKSRKENDET